MKADVISKVMAGEEFWIKADRGVIRAVGGDRVRFLNGQVTNDVSRIPVGEAWYAATCTAKGKMVADFWISNRGEEFWLDTGKDQVGVLKDRLEKYLIADDVELSILEESRLWHRWGGSGGSKPEKGFEARRYGLKGYDFWGYGELPPSNGNVLSEEELKVLRVLNRVPEWGKELSPEILPPEAGMDRNAIRYDKGCYVGQEVMARIKSIGHVSKLLVQLESKDDQVPGEGAKLVHGGKNVGWITSSVLNPLTGRGLALGYVSWTLSATDSVVDADGLALTIRPEIA
jgi:folate-binding protein YgfZ